MMLVERTTISPAVLPVAHLRSHLRLGTGFADENAEDALLESFLKAALAAVEAWTGKVLVTRDFTWTVYSWREDRVQVLPVAPVSAITALRRVDADAAINVVDPGLYRLQKDAHRPLIQATGPVLPPIPQNGQAEIDFSAGFGLTWAAVPPDLAHAVVLLAAHYFEYRAELRGQGRTMPYGVSALTEPWRTMRLLGGGRR